MSNADLKPNKLGVVMSYDGEIYTINVNGVDKFYSNNFDRADRKANEYIAIAMTAFYGAKPKQVIDETNELLQALRNVTREYAHVLSTGDNAEDIKSITCVATALDLLKKHNYKQDNPFI